MENKSYPKNEQKKEQTQQKESMSCEALHNENNENNKNQNAKTNEHNDKSNATQQQKNGNQTIGDAKKCEEYKNDLKRLAAEFDNYKKRIASQSDASRLVGQAQVLSELLVLTDEFSHAVEHEKISNETLKDNFGIMLLYKKLSSILNSFNVKEINCDGILDPNVHEVMFQVNGKPEGKICQVLRKGYLFNQKLLRPAQVSVYCDNDAYKKPDEKNMNSNSDSSSQIEESKTDKKNQNKNSL